MKHWLVLVGTKGQRIGVRQANWGDKGPGVEIVFAESAELALAKLGIRHPKEDDDANG